MGSEYEVDLDTARAIRKSLENFVNANPPGTKLTTFAMGEHVETVVTKNSRCQPDEKLPCMVELQHTLYGGYANYEVSIDTEKKKGEVTITGADFPFPAEFIIAKKQMGIHVEEDTDWCLVPFGEIVPKYCSKRRW